ncbi:DUF742 domain-containing protein [Nonomuraea deserti]|uniref:DUF742 domain-containing protein n=1 Tax=Nonomuraea deserti TaxID=1848322 RepID=A0A4R4V829_9ACTN|nr:DUF742 domain-containing protein [Nonomuraea deserti]TDC95559.1 DUF742 domain-containing protein [Nonomuraea deserti]
MIRSHTATGGDAIPSRGSLDDATLLVAETGAPPAGLPAQAHRVMDLCLPGVLSVSEVAYHLQLPGAVVKVIVSKLIDSGHLIARAPYAPLAGQHDENFLRQVLDALQKL